MKKILVVASLVALSAVACQKTEVLNPMEDHQGLIFTTEFGKLTKVPGADGGGMENLQAQDFRIWAYAASDFDNTPENDANQIFDNMKNVKVYDYVPTGASDASWKTDQQYFWPGTNKSLMFFAVSDSPAYLKTEGPTVTDSPVEIDPAARTMSIKNYVVDPLDPNKDLMVANFIKQHQGQSEKKVNLKFNHALSKVQFLFKTNGVPTGGEPITVFVQKLEVGELDENDAVVNGLKNSGTLNVTVKETTPGTEPSEGASGTAEVSTLNLDWTLDATMNIYTDNYETVPSNFPASIDGVAVTDATDKSAMELTTTEQVFATWLVLPQDVKGKKVKVTYLINGRQFTNEFNLDAFAATTATTAPWTVNQYIKYNINLSPNLITFDAEVAPWNPVAGSDVNHTN